MISNDILKEKILDLAINGGLLKNANREIWKKEVLGNVGDWKAGSTPSKANLNYYLDGTIPWLLTGDLNDGIVKSVGHFVTELAYKECSLRLNPVNSVLIAMYGATIGKVAINEIETTTNQACCACICDETIIYYKYLFYYLISIRDKLKSKAEGAGQPNISKLKICNTSIWLPPLEEQHKIVEKIEELFDLIDRKSQNDIEKEKLKEVLKEKILDSAIHGLLIKNNNKIISYEKPLFDVPVDWKWVTFSDVATIVRGGSPRPIKDYLTESIDGINWIKIGDTNPNEYYINHVKEKIKPEGMKKSRFVEKESLLLTNSMSFGRPYILNVEGCIHDGWLNIKDNGNNFYNLYMVYLLSSKFFYNVMCDKSSGAVVSNLNIDKVKSMMIPLPPLEEQHRIVEKIEECFKLIEQL